MSEWPGARRRYEAAKKTVGRKRHVAVDAHGRLLMVNLTAANVFDGAGARMIRDAIRKRWALVEHLFADGAYDRTQLLDKAAFVDVSEGMFHIAMGSLLLRRVSHQNHSQTDS